MKAYETNTELNLNISDDDDDSLREFQEIALVRPKNPIMWLGDEEERKLQFEISEHWQNLLVGEVGFYNSCIF